MSVALHKSGTRVCGVQVFSHPSNKPVLTFFLKATESGPFGLLAYYQTVTIIDKTSSDKYHNGE